MIYLVSAFDHGDQQLIKKQEVVGFSAVQQLEDRWEAQGYDVTVTMQCTKYIEAAKANGVSMCSQVVYDEEKKAQVARMVLEEGLSRKEVVRRLGIPLTTVSRWVAEHLAK